MNDGTPHGRRPVLQEQLDRELAGLAATPASRRRLDRAIARGSAPAHRPSAGRPTTRWAVPLVAAAVVAVVAVPALVEHRLGAGPGRPTVVVAGPAGQRAPATSGSPPTTVAPTAPAPGRTASTAPPTPAPSPAATTALLIAVLPDPGVTQRAATVTVTIRWEAVAGDSKAAADARAAVASKAAADAQAAADAKAGSSVVLTVRWGDGDQTRKVVTCSAGDAAVPLPLTLVYSYRRTGTYVVTADATGVGCGVAQQASRPVVVR